MKLSYSPQALQDIAEIKAYISASLHNVPAAKRIVGLIFKACSDLKRFPYMGFSVRDKLGIDSDTRMLICEKYFIVYSVHEDSVLVVRVIDGRQDYMRLLFP